MTKQPPPSAEALELTDAIRAYSERWGQHWRLLTLDAAAAIDALCEQRVSAETERCAQRVRDLADALPPGFLEQRILNWAIQVIEQERAPAERPAPPQQHYQKGDCPCGYGWNCKETGCRRPPPRDPNAWSDADA